MNLICFICGALLAFILTRGILNELWQDNLVKKSHAEYYLDEHHRRQWRMLDVPAK